MKIDPLSTTLICLAWLIYFVLHSVLASNTIKNRFSSRFPNIAPCYRLGYNIIAIAALIPILILLIVFQGPVLLEWPQTLDWLKALLIIFAVTGFFWSLRYYDLAEFSGINQCRGKGITEYRFIISPLHRYVRHPWYCFALIIIWSRDLDLMQLISAILMSSYFLIGSKFEENKLCQEYGEIYPIYKNRVPALLPLPWKKMTKKEAEELIKRS